MIFEFRMPVRPGPIFDLQPIPKPATRNAHPVENHVQSYFEPIAG
jgi:hypothetical protein